MHVSSLRVLLTRGNHFTNPMKTANRLIQALSLPQPSGEQLLRSGAFPLALFLQRSFGLTFIVKPFTKKETVTSMNLRFGLLLPGLAVHGQIALAGKAVTAPAHNNNPGPGKAGRGHGGLGRSPFWAISDKNNLLHDIIVSPLHGGHGPSSSDSKSRSGTHTPNHPVERTNPALKSCG